MIRREATKSCVRNRKRAMNLQGSEIISL